MEKMLLKHLEGSKSGQTERFDLPLSNDIILGRDTAAQIIFDPIKDDLVSRLHARLAQDPTDKNVFIVNDLNSRNGTYVNGMRITGPAKLNPGDKIELGTGGPKIEFDLDPRPALAPPATRVFSATDASPSTRVATPMTRETSAPPLQPGTSSSGMGGAGISTPNMPPTGAPGANTVGRVTVERMINQTKSSNKKLVTAITVGFVVLLAIVGGGIFWYQQKKTANIQRQAENLVAQAQEKSQQEIKNVAKQLEQVEQTGKQATVSTIAGINIAEKFTPSVVFIEASWKLIYTPTGKQLGHQRFNALELMGFLQNNISKKNLLSLVPKALYQTKLPVYIVNNNTVEPLIRDGDDTTAIGGSLTGSGFVVTNSGFILTNRHVAAPWDVPYFQGEAPLPGYLLACGESTCDPQNIKVMYLENSEKYQEITSKIKEWVPSNTLMYGGKPARGKIMEGHLDYLDVTFPKTTTPWKASLQRISENADVALIKIQKPDSTPAVSICESDPCVKVGEMITVMGYPGVSATTYAETNSYTMGSRGGSLREIPEPTVTRGNVQKIVRGEAEAMGHSISKYFSPGEIFQLAINTTGHGNSGGPVFNDQGQVVGLFTYGWGDQGGTRVSAAIPIKFGLDLMGSQQVIK